MTQVPAVVTILGLPAGTTITGAELIEAVQTTGGVANSVSLSLSQAIGALGGLPASGGTGQVLQSLGTGFAASWVTISSLVTASSGLSAAGSTTVALSLAAGSGLSVLGVAGTAVAKPLPVVGIAAQVLRINDAGTALAFGAVNLGSAAAVTGVLPGANYSAVNLAATGAGGVQGFLPGTSILTASIGGAQIATAAIGTTQLMTAAALSVLAVNSSGATNFTVISGTAAQVLRINDAGTSVGFGALNLGSAAAVTGVLPGANYSAVNVATTGAGGIQGQPFFLPTTALPAAGASTVGIRISSAAALGIYLGTGAPTFTASIGALYLNGGAVTATSRLYINTGGTTTWATFTASA